jgi:hypothetical protein
MFSIFKGVVDPEFDLLGGWSAHDNDLTTIIIVISLIAKFKHSPMGPLIMAFRTEIRTT